MSISQSLDCMLKRQVPVINKDVGYLLVMLVIAIGCFLTIFMGKGTPEASYSVLGLALGHYWGSGTKHDQPKTP